VDDFFTSSEFTGDVSTFCTEGSYSFGAGPAVTIPLGQSCSGQFCFTGGTQAQLQTMLNELVPLLSVAPSKTDQERLLVIAPELADVLSAVITRVRGADGAIPLAAVYDINERTWNPPMPLLFQRPVGRRSHQRPPGLHRPPAAAPPQRGVPLPNRRRMGRVPRPLRAPPRRARRLRTRLPHQLHPRALLHQGPPLLRIDPAQRSRLEGIRDNLLARIAEAGREGWAGEAEGLKVSLAAASNKLAQADLTAALRACATGIYPVEAGVALLISNRTFLHRGDFTSQFISHGTSGGTPMAAIDWDAVTAALQTGELPCSGGERRILQLSANIAAGAPGQSPRHRHRARPRQRRPAAHRDPARNRKARQCPPVVTTSP
jgi:hypothetical protein